MLQRHLDLLRVCKREGIEAAFAGLERENQVAPPIAEELFEQIVSALCGTPQAKLALLQTVMQHGAEVNESAAKAFFEVVQMALVGGDLAQVGRSLSAPYDALWQVIHRAVVGETEAPDLGELIVNNTVAVLGPVAERGSEWRTQLVTLCNQATANGERDMVALLDAILALLDAGGNPAGLGTNLAGPYAAMWQAIIDRLSA